MDVVIKSKMNQVNHMTALISGLINDLDNVIKTNSWNHLIDVT